MHIHGCHCDRTDLHAVVAVLVARVRILLVLLQPVWRLRVRINVGGYARTSLYRFFLPRSFLVRVTFGHHYSMMFGVIITI